MEYRVCFCRIASWFTYFTRKNRGEQLHKIFKLCGSPPDDYWKKSKLPHATLFKPQHAYESCLWRLLKTFQNVMWNLLKPCCLWSRISEGPPHLLLHLSISRRSRMHVIIKLTKIPSKQRDRCKASRRLKRKKPVRPRGPEVSRRLDTKKGGDLILGFELRKPSINTIDDDGSHTKHASQGDIPYSGPLQVPGSSGFAWARRRLDDSLSIRSRSRSSSRSLISEPSGPLHLKSYESKCNENLDRTGSRGRESNGLVIKNWNQLERPDSFDAGSDGFVKRMNMMYHDHEEKVELVEFSGPLLSQPNRIDELLERHERQIRQAVRRSWFQRGKKWASELEMFLDMVDPFIIIRFF
ncbi:hypothetical protein HanHA300_Chr00c0476g0770261 [Helianthus annuus]|nr:hypothetical protein HanHA300_Chr00c0476g0770261 [Helianthus annuus]